MNQRKLFQLFLLSAFLLLAAACAPAQTTETEEAISVESEEHTDEASHDNDDGHHDDDMEMAHMHVDPPVEFASLTNPFADNHEAIEAGAEIFQANCATCHGPEGLGDGPGAAELDPQPATLADGTMMNDLSDGYLFWRVSKGGQMEPFNSAMPAWESALTEEERWQVVSFLRTLAEDSDEHMHDVDDDHADDEHMENEEEHVDDDNSHMDDEAIDTDHMNDDQMDNGHEDNDHMDDSHEDDDHEDGNHEDEN